MKKVHNKELSYLAYLQNEAQFVHHTYEEERYIYKLLASGNSEAVDLMHQKFIGEHNGTLSTIPLRNAQYQFVVDAALIARACISGGLSYQLSYRLSDLYILKADACKSIIEVNELHLEMLADYMKRLNNAIKEGIYSKPIHQCVDYINNHLHDRITVKTLAEYTGLNASYLSVLFKKTMDVPISVYIRNKKIETAKNMLKHSDFTYVEISNMLALGPQSHFTALIKANCGFTPKQFRDRFYNYE